MFSNQSIQVIYSLIEKKRYGVEYQPFISCADGSVVAYEALARFYDEQGGAVSPVDVFRLLHDSPLMLAQVELALKQLQIEYRPKHGQLFINLDPDAYIGFGYEGRENPIIQMLADQPNLVVELIENTSVNDAEVSQRLSNELRAIGKKLALDDVGAPDSMVALPILGIVDYIKFDRSWLESTRQKNNRILLESLVEFAKRTEKITVLEGVETTEHLALANELGIDLVQGYLYRENFIEHKLF